MYHFLLILMAMLLSFSCSEKDDSVQTNPSDQSVDQIQSDQMQSDQMQTIPTAVPSFKSIFDGLLKPNCSQEACHGSERGIAGLRFVDHQEAYQQLINVDPVNNLALMDGLKRVVPNDVDKSFLWQKLTKTMTELADHQWGLLMPMSSNQIIGDKSKAILKAWIENGAPLEGADVSDFDMIENPYISHYTQCDAIDEVGMKNCFKPVENPDTTMRIYTKPITIPPHSEQLICSYLSVDIPEDIYVHHVKGLQMPGGHHSALFLALSQVEETSHPCSNAEMSNFRFVAGGAVSADTVLPTGVVLKVEAHQQLVVQSHYLNTTDEPLLVMDAVDLITLKKEEVLHQVDPFAVLYDDLHIPAHAENFEVSKTCTLDENMDIYMLLGHAHEYATKFEVYFHSADGAESRKLYMATDGHLLKENPEVKYYDPPLTFQAGDQIEIKCVWHNTTDHEIEWPEEMCVALMYYGDAKGFLTCDTSTPTPVLTGEGEATMACVAPDALGNENGVGKACTAMGGECRNNGRANTCLAIFDANANFCSFLGCQDDMECGSGAVCHMTACVPVECAE